MHSECCVVESCLNNAKFVRIYIPGIIFVCIVFWSDKVSTYSMVNINFVKIRREELMPKRVAWISCIRMGFSLLYNLGIQLIEGSWEKKKILSPVLPQS